MKLLKNNFFKVLIASLILFCSISIVFISFYFSPNNSMFNINTANFKNVILFVGDGMGENHIKTTELSNGYPLYINTNNTFKTYVTTKSKNKEITDSAAAATALSTGIKVDNGSICKLDGNNLETMAEYAKKLNKGVGIISTETLTGATPAGFSANASNRQNTDEIFLSQLNSKVDIFISAGKSYCDLKLDLINSFNASYVTTKSDLNNIINNKQQKIIASFNSIPSSNFNNENPSLANVCDLAIKYLSKFYGDNGFFLMIEEAHIDKRSHSNNINGMIRHLNNLDNTVKVVNDWAKNNNTCVFVTADHETGNLEYLPETEIANSWYQSKNHTNKNVPLFCFSNKANWIFKNNNVIDNTEVSQIIRNLLK